MEGWENAVSAPVLAGGEWEEQSGQGGAQGGTWRGLRGGERREEGVRPLGSGRLVWGEVMESNVGLGGSGVQRRPVQSEFSYAVQVVFEEGSWTSGLGSDGRSDLGV